MKHAEMVEVIVKALPHSDHISEWGLTEEDAVRFKWRGDYFRVSLREPISVEQVEGHFLAGSNLAILMGSLLRRTWLQIVIEKSEVRP